MEDRTRERMRDLVLERDRTAALLKNLELRIAALDQQSDLLCEIAEAEDRGDWRLAARLRRAGTRAQLAPL